MSHSAALRNGPVQSVWIIRRSADPQESIDESKMNYNARVSCQMMATLTATKNRRSTTIGSAIGIKIRDRTRTVEQATMTGIYEWLADVDQSMNGIIADDPMDEITLLDIDQNGNMYFDISHA